MIATSIRGRDAEARLGQALQLAGHAAGLAVAVTDSRARAWASATYVGTQVTLTLCAPRAAALGRWLSDLPLAEVSMRGYLLASLALDRIEDDGTTIATTVTALVIED